MQVRAFEGKDSGHVRDLVISVLSKEYPIDKEAYKDESDLSDICRSYGGKRDAFLVLESEGRIMGTIGIKEDSRDTALLRRLFVDPACRRRGYGELLLEKGIRHCKRNKFKHIAFRTTGRMSQAINLLRKMKFREAEKIDVGGLLIYKFSRDL